MIELEVVNLKKYFPVQKKLPGENILQEN